MTPEFTRPFILAQVGEHASVTVEANAAERDAVAHRMGVPGLRGLTCRFDLRRGEGGSVVACGLLRARPVQTCVVTLEPFETAVEEAFCVRFVPAGHEKAEFDPGSDDEIPFSGATIDLGEAATEQLALALDPFPRKPGAKVPSQAERRESPFEALARFGAVLGRGRG